MRITFLATLICSFATSVYAQAPEASGAVNAASFANQNLPNGGIAQGSMFTIFGANLGPDAPVTPTAFPLESTLGGSSVTVAVGGVTLDCPVVVSFAAQLSAIMPSNAPLGAGALTITTAAGSTTLDVEVVAHSPGVFALSSAGAGPGVLTTPTFGVNTLTSSAQSGQLWDVWATGLGAIQGSDADAPPVGNLPYDIQVIVGGQEAQVVYAGRSGCCSALDQIRFVVPEGVEGCYVPVVVVVNRMPSNFTTMSVAASGQVCSDAAAGLSANLIEQGQQSGTLRLGHVSLQRLKLTVEAFGQTFEQNIDSATALFTEYTFDQFIRAQGHVLISGRNGCSVFSFSGSEAQIVDPVRGLGLDAGEQGALTGPDGQETLAELAPGIYRRSTGLDFGGGAALREVRKFSDEVRKGQFGLGGGFLGEGDYTATFPGGADVGALSAQISVPPAFTWTNRAAASSIDRGQPFTVEFSGGPANSTVQIFGFSAYEQSDDATAGAVFICRGDGSSGSYTIPAAVLSALPASAPPQGLPTGVLGVGSLGYDSFTADGIDQGNVSQIDINVSAVTYQ